MEFDIARKGAGSRKSFKALLAVLEACTSDEAVAAQRALMESDGDVAMASFAWHLVAAAERALIEMDPGDVEVAKRSVQSDIDLDMALDAVSALGMEVR